MVRGAEFKLRQRRWCFLQLLSVQCVRAMAGSELSVKLATVTPEALRHLHKDPLQGRCWLGDGG